MAGLALVSLVAAACGGTTPGRAAPASTTLTLYTCVTDATQKAVVAGFTRTHPGVTVQVFRAPTGQLNARVAGDVRSGGLRADVVWACDPLTMQGYVRQRLVGGWTPPNASDLPAAYRTTDAVGAALLYVVAVHRHGTPAPASWADLTGPAYRNALALPDPACAASALGAVGWFVVKLPDDVTTGVAQGIYKAGVTIASSANAAKKAGSPLDVVWPRPGAVAVWGPVAVSRTSAHPSAARALVEYVVSEPGQRALASTGAYPTRPGVPGPPLPAGASVVSPDWSALAGRTAALLAGYRAALGG